jgi:hypothetical protein
MGRTFSAESLVSMPRVNVDSGLALWQALRAVVAAESKLPKFIQAPWSVVDREGTQLFDLAQARLAEAGKGAGSAAKRNADSVVDNAVGALAQFLESWTRLPDSLPQAQLAAAARQALFPEGTGFLNLPFEQEWTQVERRLRLMKSEGLDKDIERLGGAPFVKHLVEAQAAYGKALGLTKVVALPAETVGLREPLDALLSALRLYVIKVTAYRDDAEPETVALADRLLRPLVSWVSKPSKAGSESEPESDPEPESGPDPAAGPAPRPSSGGPQGA